MNRTMINIGLPRYGTRMLTAGDRFEATPRDARVFLALKKARLATKKDGPTPVLAPSPTVEELQAEAARLEIHVDKRWGATRLQEEIAKARA